MSKRGASGPDGGPTKLRKQPTIELVRQCIAIGTKSPEVGDTVWYQIADGDEYVVLRVERVLGDKLELKVPKMTRNKDSPTVLVSAANVVIKIRHSGFWNEHGAGRQMRSRFVETLDPNRNAGEWTAAEDAAIVASATAHCGKHAAPHDLPGWTPTCARTGQQVRNRWNDALKVKVAKHGGTQAVRTKAASTLNGRVSGKQLGQLTGDALMAAKQAVAKNAGAQTSAAAVKMLGPQQQAMALAEIADNATGRTQLGVVEMMAGQQQATALVGIADSANGYTPLGFQQLFSGPQQNTALALIADSANGYTPLGVQQLLSVPQLTTAMGHMAMVGGLGWSRMGQLHGLVGAAAVDRAEMEAAARGRMGQEWAADALARGKTDVWTVARGMSSAPETYDDGGPLALAGFGCARQNARRFRSMLMATTLEMPAADVSGIEGGW